MSDLQISASELILISKNPREKGNYGSELVEKCKALIAQAACKHFDDGSQALLLFGINLARISNLNPFDSSCHHLPSADPSPVFDLILHFFGIYSMSLIEESGARVLTCFVLLVFHVSNAGCQGWSE